MAIKVDPTNKWLKGMDAETISFANDQEMHEVMKKKEYATDPSLRLVVSKMIENGLRFAKEQAPATPTHGVLERAMHPRSEARKLEDDAILREQTVNLMGAVDAKGKPMMDSPSYRRMVDNWLIENNDALDKVIGNKIIDRNISKGAIRVELGNGSAQSVRDEQAAYRDLANKKTLADKHAALDRGESTDITDLGGVRH
jgi:hypothetical protein